MRHAEGTGPLVRRAARREAARRRVVKHRRLAALVAVAGFASLLGALLGARSADEGESAATSAGEEREPTGAGASPVACDPAIAGDPRRLAGRMLVIRMEAGAPPELLRRVRAGELGGVILFPPDGTQPGLLAREIGRLQRAGAAAGQPPLLVAIDQEGGPVKRLPGLPPKRSPAELAIAGAEAALLAEREGEATGTALAELGINLDLAPVLDVPAPGSFVAERAFGSRPATVSERGLAFARGLEAGGVGATAKHFPGLGLAEANTDLEASTVEASLGQLQPGLEPFRRASEAGVAAIMPSNALYPALDARAPASLSRTVLDGLLRTELGFEGVVVTDDLGAGAIAAAGLEEGEAAVRAASAGADLLLFALSDGLAAHRALVRAIRRERLDPAALLASCARTTALAERLTRGEGAGG